MARPRIPPPASDEIPLKQPDLLKHLGMPMSKSKFHRMIKDGKIVPAKIGNGYYLLNATREVLGLPQFTENQITDIKSALAGVDQLPPQPITELDRLIVLFATIEPLFLKCYIIRNWPSEFSADDWRTMEILNDIHKPTLGSIHNVYERVYYILRELKAAEERQSAPRQVD